MKPWPALPALLLVSCLPVLASSREQRARGAAVFSSAGCQHCHTIGSVGGHRGPNLSNIGRMAKKAAIRNQILYGSKIMPSFDDVLAPQEIDDLVVYLRSCRERPKDPLQTASSK